MYHGRLALGDPVMLPRQPLLCTCQLEVIIHIFKVVVIIHIVRCIFFAVSQGVVFCWIAPSNDHLANDHFTND